ncbi:MAG: chemotaxis response regulator protein-glutamate methylesterase [Gammaproteobacteria bacterium]
MRIAIVNDTRMALEVLKRIVASAPQHEIAWLAQDGVEAVRRCQADTPDLILMDLIMPNMDGVEATRQIMTQSPCAILVVTSTVAGNTAQVFEAMGVGALDAVNTPVLDSNDISTGAEVLLHKIDTIARLIGSGPSPAATAAVTTTTTTTSKDNGLIAIGSSTGGPAALARILGALPADLPAAVVIVQHVDVQFCADFIQWLNTQSTLPVRMAAQQDALVPGVVLVANSEKHLSINARGRVAYVDEPAAYAYRPSVNVLFSSVAQHWQGQALGVLLTGMGRDGAIGLLEMRQRGFATLAQDETSCAVYGMPKAAVALDAADRVLHISKMAPAMTDWALARQQKMAAKS